MNGLLLCWLASAATPDPASPAEPASIPVGVPGAPPTAPAQADAPVVTPPTPIDPLTVAWPADEPAPFDAEPVVVKTELLVNEQGVVEEATLKDGYPPFSDLVIAHLLAVRFTPAMESGAPVAVYVPVEVAVAPPPIAVEGIIRLAGGDLPAVGLLVTCGGQSMTTGDDGRFAFRGVPLGEQTLTVTATTVKVEDQRFAVTADEVVHLELWARAPQNDLGIVGVYRKERDEVVRRSISAEELRTLPGTMGDPLRAISNLPGAVRTPLDAGWLLVRGGDPRDTGVYIDGTRVPLIYHIGGFTSVVHPGMVDRVEFYPGGQSARYGRATAGAVDLLTRKRPEELEIRAGANIVLAGGYVAVPIGKKAAVSAAFRRSYLDAVLNVIPGITQEQANIAPRFWDYQFRGDYDNASVFGLGYVDTLDASAAGGERAVIETSTHRLHGSAKYTVFGKTVMFKPYYAYELNKLTIDSLEREQTLQKNGGGGRLELQDAGEGMFGWSLGADMSFDWFTMQFSGQQGKITRSAHLDSPDGYVDVRIGEKIRAVVGVRVDTLLVTGQLPRVAPSPRGSLSVPIGEYVTLLADGGLYHQPPPAEMMIGPPEGSALLLEQSYGGGGGARFKYGNWEVGLDAYGRKITRMTSYEKDGSLGQIEGDAAGLEAMVRYSDSRVSGWVSYSYSSSQRREEPTDLLHPSNYDQPHSLVAVGAVNLGKNWTLGARFRFASGFAISDEELVEAYDILAAESKTLLPDQFGRTEPFHALDLKISKKAEYRQWRLEYYLDVQNVYNRRVAEPLISGVWEAYGTQTYGYGLPVLPILGIEAIVAPKKK